MVGCLRNSAAVADVMAARLENGDSVAVIAAGERWRGDDSLRPSLEDHLGAGAVLSALASLGYRDAMSPEASAAADLFDVVRPRLAQSMHECVGARELQEMGFGSDVEVAASLDVSRWSRRSSTGPSGCLMRKPSLTANPCGTASLLMCCRGRYVPERGRIQV